MGKNTKHLKKISYIIPAFVAGTIISGTVATAATNYVNAQKMGPASISVNGKQIQAPRLMYGNTSYTGIWWLQRALNVAGFQTSWDGKTFNITGQNQQSNNSVAIVNGFQVKSFVQGTSSTTKPDDITTLNGNIFLAYQNGVGSKGEPTSSGITNSTIVEYGPDGSTIASWSITGKCDGMAADVANNRIVATVNEDGNSSMYVITPGNVQTQHLTYSPDPATAQNSPLATGGGTDSIAFQNGNMYITASAPSADASGNYTHASLFQGTIKGNVVSLSPVMMGNDKATDASSGNSVTLNLSDPDSSTVVPTSSPKYAGDLLLDSQGDSELIFLQNPGTSSQALTRLTVGTQVDDTTFATSTSGTLYITDGGSNTVYAMTGNFTPGTVFVACPSDSGVAGFVGTLDLSSGTITPFAIGLKSPKGLLFVPKAN